MPIINGISGVRDGSFNHLILDAGVIYVNINETLLNVGGSTAFANAINPDNTWTDEDGILRTPGLGGVTRGGTAFNLNKKERPVEFDSRRLPVKNTDRVDMIEPTIKTMLLESAQLQTTQLMLGGSSSNTSTPGWTKVTPNLIIQASDYTPNMALVATVSGAESMFPYIILLRNVRCNVVGSMAFKDHDESVYDVTLLAHASETDPFGASGFPVIFYIPTNESGVAYYS